MLKSKSEIEGFKSRLKQYRLAKSEDSLLNYWDYMSKLSSKKAKDWLENEDITLTLMLNDNTYNYKEFYDKDKEQAMKMLTADSEAHFTDVGKTVLKNSYSDGTDSITDHETYIPKEVEMNLKLYDINHTDLSTGIKSPFYNSADNTYGTVPLEGLEVTAPLTKSAINAILGRRGIKAYHEGAKTAFKVAAPIVFGAGLAAMSGAGLMSAAINPIDVATIVTDPSESLNYIPFALQSLKYIPEVPNAIRYVDRGFTPESKVLKQTDNTLTRYVGTGDSGYRDALTSGVIRGNMTPALFNAKSLGKINKKLKDKISDSDLRDLNSNNINSENFNRINEALKSLETNNGSGIRLLKHYSLGDAYEDYLKQIEKDRLNFNLLINNWDLNKSPEINDWIKNWNGHNLATFARENEILDNKLLFPGDYAVKINNADKWEREATSLGHFAEHKVTYKPIEFNNSDVTWYKRKNGIFSRKKYMVEVPRKQVMLDYYKYNNLDTKNYSIGFGEYLNTPNLNIDWQHTMNEFVKGVKESRALDQNPTILNTISNNELLAERIGLEGIKPSVKRLIDSKKSLKLNIKVGDVGKKNIMGSYEAGDNTIYLNQNAVPWIDDKLLQGSGFHEGIHSNFRGIQQIELLKNSKLFKDNVIPYLDNSVEGIANVYETGKLIGLEMGSKYPGYTQFKLLLNDFKNSNNPLSKIVDLLRLNSKRDYKRAFDAMTGLYYTTAGITAGTGLMLNNKKTGGKDGKIFIPKYADGTDSITDHETYIPKEVEMNLKLYDINHTDLSTGIKSPFYNSADNTYGTVPLEGLEVTAPLTKSAINAILGRRGIKAYHEGAKTAFKVAAPIVFGAGLAAMSGAGLMSAAINPIDVASIAIDPVQPLNYLPFALQSLKYIPEVPNAIRYVDRRIDRFKNASERLKRFNLNYTENVKTLDAIRDKDIGNVDTWFENEKISRLNSFKKEHPEFWLENRRNTLKELLTYWKNALNEQKINVSLDENDLRGLTLELNDILNTIVKEDPGYIEYAKSKNLPLLELTTLDKWIDKLRSGIRGVYSPKENAQLSDLEDMFTRTREVNTGGDRLNTEGGIYVSNSLELADKFSRSFYDKGGTAALAVVLSADIDRSKPFVDLLRLLRRRIYPYNLNTQLTHVNDPKTLIENGYMGIQAQYANSYGQVLPTYETAYFSNNPGEKLLDVKEFNTSNDVANLRGRWGANVGGASTTDDLFSPRYIGESFGDFMHNIRVLEKQKPEAFTPKRFDPYEEFRASQGIFLDVIPTYRKKWDEVYGMSRSIKNKRTDTYFGILNKYRKNIRKANNIIEKGIAGTAVAGLIGGIGYMINNPSENTKKNIEKSKLKKTIKTNQNE